MFGRRLEDLRNGFSVPPDTTFPNLSSQASSESGALGGGIPDLSFGTNPDISRRARSMFVCSQDFLDTAATWKEKITWLRTQSDLELWVKGGISNTKCQPPLCMLLIYVYSHIF